MLAILSNLIRICSSHFITNKLTKTHQIGNFTKLNLQAIVRQWTFFNAKWWELKNHRKHPQTLGFKLAPPRNHTSNWKLRRCNSIWSKTKTYEGWFKRASTCGVRWKLHSCAEMQINVTNFVGSVAINVVWTKCNIREILGS